MYINTSRKTSGNIGTTTTTITPTFSASNASKNIGPNTIITDKQNMTATSGSTTTATVSPTRIFPENDFVFDHKGTFNNNNNNVSTNTSNKQYQNSDYFQVSPSKQVPYAHLSTRETTRSSLDFINRPKRINEFQQRSKDDDLIKLNTERNRYIPMRSKSLPFNSLKLKSNLKNSSSDPRNNRRHQRSKSVHFDEVLPVKFFSKYECPTRVSRHNSDCDVIEKINFDQVKPLRRFQYDDSSDDDYDDDNDNDHEELDSKEDGLYDVNFAILNNPSNVKDIKLNVFVNRNNGDNSTIILQNIKLEKRKTYNNLNDYFIWGKINVKNIFFEKCIYIRYTLNDWKTFNEVKATYIHDPLQTTSHEFDTFEFSLYSLKSLILNENEHIINQDNIIEGNLQFCIHYETENYHTGEKLDFWNNNDNKNYSMHIVLHDKDNDKKFNHNNNNNNNTNDILSDTTTIHDKNHDITDDSTDIFKTDKYYNIANELGGFNKKNNKFGKYKNSFAYTDNQKKIHSTFLDDLLDQKNFIQLNDGTENDNNKSNLYNDNDDLDDDDDLDDNGPFWFNNNVLLTTNKNDNEQIFFKDFRNPFAN